MDSLLPSLNASKKETSKIETTINMKSNLLFTNLCTFIRKKQKKSIDNLFLSFYKIDLLSPFFAESLFMLKMSIKESKKCEILKHSKTQTVANTGGGGRI
jgi:hypothetical protein